MRQSLTLFALFGAITQATHAQEQEPFERLALRVNTVSPQGSLTVDRGTRDGLALGGLVQFFPRQGGTVSGSIIQVAERTAVVEIRDRTIAIEPGTRGEAVLPKSRFAPPAKAADPPPEAAPDAKRPEWQNQDEDYRPGMPLLAKVRPVKPQDRQPSVTGRLYTVTDFTYTTVDSLHNSFLRTGAEAHYDNLFGDGGTVHVNGEINWRTEQNDQEGADLLLRGLSYERGGTRFAPTRWEVGRFPQQGMPEFGVLDGVEWGQRTSKGHRFGASLGYLPEPDDDYDAFEDFQIAGYYRWVADDLERLTVSGGLQKTFHHGKTDRDLLIVKSSYLPADGWTLHGSTWVDFYHGRDNLKGRSIEVTQATAALSRRWTNGNGLDLTYRRIRFPEIQRQEFLFPTPQRIADNRYDRLALDGSWMLSKTRRLHAQIAGFDDEDDSGGAAELGYDVQDVGRPQSRLDAAVFGTVAQFSNVLGIRVSYGWFTDDGRWDMLYEIANHHLARWPDQSDDLWQHRVFVSRTVNIKESWDFSLHSEIRVWDEDLALSLGFQLQKTF